MSVPKGNFFSFQIYAFVGDIVLSNLLAIPVTLLFELPFGTIEKYFFRNVSIFPFPRRTNKVLVSTGSGKMENKDIEKGNDNANFEKDSWFQFQGNKLLMDLYYCKIELVKLNYHFFKTKFIDLTQQILILRVGWYFFV